jgi:hypothetical protein
MPHAEAGRPAAGRSRALRQGRDPRQQALTGTHWDRACTNIFASLTVVGALPGARSDPDLSAIGTVDGNTILLHDHRVGALGHWRASKDTDRLAEADRSAEEVSRRGATADRQHGLAVREQVGMGDSVAVDRAISMRRQVHCGDYILHEYPSGSSSQRHVVGRNDRSEPRLYLLEGLSNCHQRVVMGKTIVAQPGHRGRPS